MVPISKEKLEYYPCVDTKRDASTLETWWFDCDLPQTRRKDKAAFYLRYSSKHKSFKFHHMNDPLEVIGVLLSAASLHGQ